MQFLILKKMAKLVKFLLLLSLGLSSFSCFCQLEIKKDFLIKIDSIEISATRANNTFEIKSFYTDIKFHNINFIEAAFGTETVTETRGSFFINDKILQKFQKQTIEQIYVDKNYVIIEGFVCSKKVKIPYKMTLAIVNSKVHFKLTFSAQNPPNRIILKIPAKNNEYFYGLGEQFTHLKLNGHFFHSFISEQGIGRGKQPLTLLVDLVAKSGGKYYTTYFSTPFFFSTRKFSLLINNNEYCSFDFRAKHKITITIFSSQVEGILNFGNIKNLICQNAQIQGLMRPLPDWVHKGAIVGLQGGTRKVSAIYDSLKKYKTPITALWLQDWVGQRKTSFGKQLWWNWQLDSSQYPNWPIINQKIIDDSVFLLVYLNPFLVDASSNPKHKVNLFDIAKQNDFFIKKTDGQIYLIRNTDFSAGMLDLTNPQAIEWFKEVVKQNVLLYHNIRGWMADFGEALPYDAVLFSKINAAQLHNIYPVLWAQINRQIIESLPNGYDFVFFTRAGFTNSTRYSTLFWEGDQLVSWDKYDGIKSAVVGLLSSSLSGIPLNHSDIGGYTGIANPLAKHIRSKELLWRWIELNAFGVVFRSHEGNLPDLHHQIYSDPQTIKHFSRYAQIFSSFFEYRKMLIQQACQTGMPIIRPMFLVFENDNECYKIEYEQFMLGEDFLIAPVLDKGHRRKKVYLPQGTWIDLWSGQKIKSDGRYYKFESPIEKIPVFYLENSKYGPQIAEKVKMITVE